MASVTPASAQHHSYTRPPSCLAHISQSRSPGRDSDAVYKGSGGACSHVQRDAVRVEWRHSRMQRHPHRRRRRRRHARHRGRGRRPRKRWRRRRGRTGRRAWVAAEGGRREHRRRALDLVHPAGTDGGRGQTVGRCASGVAPVQIWGTAKVLPGDALLLTLHQSAIACLRFPLLRPPSPHPLHVLQQLPRQLRQQLLSQPRAVARELVELHKLLV